MPNNKEEDIRELLGIMDVDLGNLSKLLKERMGQIVMVSVSPDKAEEAKKFLEEFFADDPFVSRMTNAHVKAYDSRFTHIEIKDLLEFYESTIGRKLVRAIGDITKDILKANRNIVPDLIDMVNKGLTEAGIIPKDEGAEAAKDKILAGIMKRLSN